MSLTRVFANTVRTTPKTSLGFYAGVIGLCFAGMAGLIVAVAGSSAASWAIPAILVIGFALVIGVVITVITINVKHPEKLMLGQITGGEYLAIHKYQLGDSQSGERTVALGEDGDVIDAEVANADSEQPALPAHWADDPEEDDSR